MGGKPIFRNCPSFMGASMSAWAAEMAKRPMLITKRNIMEASFCCKKSHKTGFSLAIATVSANEKIFLSRVD